MKLSPKIKLGCKSCNKHASDLTFNIDAGQFRFGPIKQEHKVTSVISSKKTKKNNKVNSLF